MLAHVLGGELVQVHVVQVNGALGGLVEARQELDQGGLARAHRPDHGDAFACFDAERFDLENRFVFTIGKGGLLQLDEAVAVFGHDQAGVVFTVAGHGHDVVKRGQRDLGVFPLHQHLRYLRQRTECAAADDAAGNQPAGGQGACADGVGAGGNQQHIVELLQHLGDVGGAGRQHALLEFGAANGGGEVAVAVLHFPFATGGLDGLDAVHRFNQQTVFAVGLLHVLAGDFFERAGQQPAGNDGDRDHDQRNQRHIAGDVPHDGHKEQRKRSIGQHKERGRCQEVTDRFEVADLRGEGADRGGAGVHADAHGLVKKDAGELLVNHLGGAVHHVRADLLHEHLQTHGDDHTNRQDPQRREALAGHHPVIHLHGVERAHEGQRTDDEGGKNGFDENALVLAHGKVKPLRGAALGVR